MSNCADQAARAPVAFITGVTGQDGSYLAEFLISKGYVVHGMIRRASTFNTSRIDHLIRDKHAGNLSNYDRWLVNGVSNGSLQSSTFTLER